MVPAGLKADGSVCAAIRPQAIDVRAKGSDTVLGRNRFMGTVVETGFLGDVVEATVEIRGYRFRATFSPYEPIVVGDEVSLDFGEGRCVIVNDDLGTDDPASGPAR